MSSKNDTEGIIKEFLDLWQKQFEYLSKDPETIASMLKMFQQMQEGYFNTIRKESKRNAEPNSASDVSGNDDDELRKLRTRITGLEKRIVELESGACTAGKKTAGGNPDKKSGRADKRTSKPVK